MNKVVLDSSSLLALIQQEAGAELVKSVLKFSSMSAINVAECLTVLERTGVKHQEASMLIQDIVKDIVVFDMEQAELVASLQLRIQHKGISLGDKACIALGIKLQATIYTADRICT
ncbi:MAG: PIN domain-containing protein [Pedobacter sp.]|nr:MAG: PIN domain-containing protein [Pedobacter sp.]